MRKATSTSTIQPQLLNDADAAKWLGIGRRKLWSMMASGEIPVVRVGRSVRYDVDDLREFVASNKEGGGP
ncbi:helix-turn-helix domain-containing protein [Roseimaritima ulvae]|uniref:Helix-turn-helix domain protein n=1 Tax=Roseimaritima ulvae TaxID=980254 RepID=A0A5B9R203_9BACT|nr:helix-turn-helix domain-containing protein [Roseimaritima ulvae]QEG43456.1 Helix-turn-helix domain protein [Roseimaritima ulvae]